MPWDYTPITAAVLTTLGGLSFLNHEKYVDQYWWALAERVQAAGQNSPFKQNHEYATFHIDSIVDNGDGSYTITDAAGAWMTGAGHRRWIDAVAGETGVPTWATTGGYHAVIDADRTGAGLSKPDPRQVIRGAITDNTGTTLRVVLPVARWIRERRITALGDLAGRHGWIIKTTGYDWTRAFMERAQGPIWSYGRIEAIGTDGANRTIKSKRPIAHAATAVGREIIYFAAGIMQRGTITAIDAPNRTITYSGTTADATVGAGFYVTTAGAFFTWRGDDPTPTGPGVQAAWAGLANAYYAHASGRDSDEKTTSPVPRLTFPVRYAQTLDACPIDPEPWDVRASVDTLGRDPDTFIPEDNACGDGDVLLMEKFYQCYRAILSGLMWTCEGYCDRAIYDSDNPGFIAPFSVGGAMYAAGVNPYAGATGAVVGGGSGGVINAAFGAPVGAPLWWEIRDGTGKGIMRGYTSSYNGATLTAPGVASFITGVHDGQAIVGSPGPDRWFESAFTRMRDGVYFLAGVDGDPPAAQPVSELYPGTFYTDSASIYYLTSDLDGLVSSHTIAMHAVTNGDIARYVGHRTYDPGFPVLLPADVPDPLADFHNRGSVSLRTKTIRKRLAAATQGKADGGSNRRLIVANLDWDALDFWGNTNGKTHEFTPVAGGVNSCTVPGAAGSTLWAAGRFPGFAGPMVGLCIEVRQSGYGWGDPGAVIERRLIATGTTGGAITWAENCAASVVGKVCRIVEPLVLNPWKGLKIQLTNGATGATATVLIEGNRFDTLFIADPGFAVDATTSYKMIVPKIGDVFKRVAGEWVTTSNMGVDARYGGSHFKKNAANNLGDLRRGYGLPLPMDVSPQFLSWHTQLYNFFNVVTDMIGPDPTWHGYAVDGVPEYNTAGIDSEFATVTRGDMHTTYAHLDTHARALAYAAYAATLPGGQDPGAGPVSAIHHMCDEEFCQTLTMVKSYGYLQIETHFMPEFFPMTYTSRAYCYATIGGDPGADPGVVEVHDPSYDPTALIIRTESYFDTSLGLPFRQWQSVGGGAPGTRIKVGGDLSSAPVWGTTIDESPILSSDHPSGTLESWHVTGGASVARKAVVIRFPFKFGPDGGGGWGGFEWYE